MGVWKDKEEVFGGRKIRYLIFLVIIVVYIVLFGLFLYSLSIDPLIPALIVVATVFLIPVFMVIIDILFYTSNV